MTDKNGPAGRERRYLRLVAEAPASSTEVEGRAETSRLARGAAIDRLVGLEIARQRNEIRMTRQALGDALGVSAETIESYETGRFRIGPKLLVTLAQLLRCPPSKFFRAISETGSVDAASVRATDMPSAERQKELDKAQDKLLDAIDDIYAVIGSLARLKRGDEAE